MTYNAIIIGGSFAGLSAALMLGRARQRVLVIDEGNRRNRFVAASHGFLGQDGRAPGDIIADARAEVMAYPTVEWANGHVERAEKIGRVFRVTEASGEVHEAQRLVLAMGVVDELPAVPGLAERWGRSVFYCPYCDGYELMNGKAAVLATSLMAMHQAVLLPDWAETTLLLNDVFEPDAEQRAQLARRGVTVVAGGVREITGDRADVVLADGRVLAFQALFVEPRPRIASPIAQQLGCELEDGMIGPIIKTDMMRETTVPGVFACGDAATLGAAVALAVGTGAMAGVMAHQSLVFRSDA
ncbi:NAD(P)/FAD-dependent oxidoreductase [Arenibaculum pallidiluteum]|uniref:NAD(P)/FAD-dependent oxidoreductase n=1 Tax=Arenibaculum pallidiluteum TaxID=2812559 RepID=UPI001A977F24|nr:NAD(P)/FAD-dependent oxidoreductase [Arenibaculum pallidiluteum]